MVVDQTARLHESGFRQAVVADQNARTQRKGAGGPVRLAGDRAADVVGDIAQLQPVADFETQLVQHRLVDQRAPAAVLPVEAGVQRLLRLQADAAVERVGGIDALQFDQRASALAREAVGRACHRAQIGGLGQPGGVVAQVGELLVRRRLVDQPDLHLPAQKRATVVVQALQHRLRQRAHAGDRGDAEQQAGEEDLEALQPAAQFAPRQPGGQRQVVRQGAHARVLMPGC